MIRRMVLYGKIAKYSGSSSISSYGLFGHIVSMPIKIDEVTLDQVDSLPQADLEKLMGVVIVGTKRTEAMWKKLVGACWDQNPNDVLTRRLRTVRLPL